MCYVMYILVFFLLWSFINRCVVVFAVLPCRCCFFMFRCVAVLLFCLFAVLMFCCLDDLLCGVLLRCSVVVVVVVMCVAILL